MIARFSAAGQYFDSLWPLGTSNPAGILHSTLICLCRGRTPPNDRGGIDSRKAGHGNWRGGTGSTFKRYHILRDREMRLAAARILYPMANS